MKIKKITCWILQSASIYNALIAILTSAIVTLLAGGNISDMINYWLLGGVLIAVVTIVLLSYLSGISQAVCNRAMALREENGQTGESTIEDAYAHVIRSRSGNLGKVDNNGDFILSHEKKILISFFSMVVLVVALVCLSWKGDKHKEQQSKLFESVEQVKVAINDNQSRSVLMMDSLLFMNQKIMDSLQIIKTMIPKELQTQPSPQKVKKGNGK